MVQNWLFLLVQNQVNYGLHLHIRPDGVSGIQLLFFDCYLKPVLGNHSPENKFHRTTHV